MASILDLPASEAENRAQAAALLEQSVRAGCKEPEAYYLLAMCYKQMGRGGDAMNLLTRIHEPDANVLLQRGLIAFAGKNYEQAEKDLLASWSRDPALYAAGYNLFLAQLCQGKRIPAGATIARLIPLAPSDTEGRFLSLLQGLFQTDGKGSSFENMRGTVESISVDDEHRLVGLLSGLGHFDVVGPLLEWLVQCRPTSQVAYQAYFRATLLQGKFLIDRAHWEEAYSLLSRLARQTPPRAAALELDAIITMHCLAGSCVCILQDYDRALGHFRYALDTFQRDPQAPTKGMLTNSQGVSQRAWLEQNVALVYEWQGKYDRAEAHWNRYFDALEANFNYSRPAEHLRSLAFSGLTRLADTYGRQDLWNSALGFLSRASQIRPEDAATLEQLFNIYTQLRRHDDARKILRRLRQNKPNDPQVELFELDVRDVRDLDDLDRLLADVRRVVQRHPNNMQVEERAGTMIVNLMPFMEKLADQFSNQVRKVLDQMRRLPSYQINWPVVREIMSEQEDKFYQLRRAANRALTFVTGDHRRDLQKLISLCDRKIEHCRSMGESSRS